MPRVMGAFSFVVTGRERQPGLLSVARLFY
jgi:hypothetical protein